MAADPRAHMTFKIGAIFSEFAGKNARFLAHPADDQGHALPDQPTAEKSAELERDAECFERWAKFYDKLAEAV